MDAEHSTKRKFDLQDRTTKFGERIIVLYGTIPETTIKKPIIDQIIRSGTSIGANYREANGASSKRDFRNKIHIAKKEIQETKHWLQLLATAHPPKKTDIHLLWQECHELNLIFQKITSSLRQSRNH